MECDVKNVVKWIKEAQDSAQIKRPNANLVRMCRNLLDRQWRVRIEHIYREQNCVANALARMATSYNRGYYEIERP